MPRRIQSALRCMSRSISACCTSPRASRILVAALRCVLLQVAHGALHALFELLQVLNLAFLLGGQLLACSRVMPWLCCAEGPAHLAFELLLAARQILGLPRRSST